MTSGTQRDDTTGLEIAIVAMAGRFPGAPTLEAFWDNLCSGVESVQRRQAEAGGAVAASAVIDHVEDFDAALFGLAPREAEILDPQQRIFLECAWEALERGGYDPRRYKGAIGVYAGAGMNTYLLNNLISQPELVAAVGDAQIKHGNDKDFLSTRVSYLLDLRGPSVVVQSGCSTSLLAVHLACRSLLGGECDMALAGGVAVRTPQEAAYAYREGGVASPDGYCRAFDADAQGTVFGNGAGVVLLKRLEDARSDGDPILAVIKGSAANNDGSRKPGFTAPSVAGQAEVVRAAHAVAEVDPATISYVEAHGTGTILGDPIEVAALTGAFQALTQDRQFCALGTLKPNIGHLDTAAGIAGLIKTVLALQHRRLPPTLHYTRPNPSIDFANSPFYVCDRAADWQPIDGVRRAGVSSFGIGGTNVHLVLEEAPPAAPSAPARAWQALVLSGKTPAARAAQAANLARYLRDHPDAPLADVAYTLQVGRRAFSHRQLLVCADREGALRALEAGGAEQSVVDESDSAAPVAFLFSGQGSQYAGMARGLYASEPVFRRWVDECARLLAPHLGLDLRGLLFESNDQGPTTKDQRPRADAQGSGLEDVDVGRSSFVVGRLEQTQYAQPALFVVEYALAQLWQSWGVAPQALIGHSIGEYVAACLAGVFSLEDALALVAARGRLMGRLPEGAMLSVGLPAEALEARLGPELAVAAVNAPRLCVVAGPPAAVAALEQALGRDGVECRRLHTAHAFHSPALDPILEPFEALVRQVRLSPPRLPVVSNLTGGWLQDEQATDPAYWAQHMRQPVRFAQGLATLLEEQRLVLLEVGPGHSLAVFARQHPACGPGHRVLHSLPHPREQAPDEAVLQTALGRLWLAGAPVDWPAVHAHEQRRRVALPTYPFERQRYWVSPGAAGALRRTGAAEPQADLGQWAYVPTWQEALPPQPGELAAAPPEQQPWLVFLDAAPLGARLAEHLTRRGHPVTAVEPGAAFAQRGPGAYSIRPGEPEDYRQLLQQLGAQGQLPAVVAHLWNVGAAQPAALESAAVEAAQERGFYSLLWLAQALGEICPQQQVRLGVAASQICAVESHDRVAPERATLIGPCKVIPLEYEQISCQLIDIPPAAAAGGGQPLVEALVGEIVAASPARLAAYRGARRWLATYSQLALAPAQLADRLRQGGVYLITGGLGGMGLALARQLSRSAAARVVLLGHTALPPRDTWDGWLAAHPADDRVSRHIRNIRDLEADGVELLVLHADVADPAAVRGAVEAVLERYGALHGVIHAAGVGGGGLIQVKTRAAAEAVFRPKVYGILALREAVARLDLDFLVIFSSMASVVGAFGRVDYCAANAFLDAYAAHQAAQGGPPTLTVNWQTWQQTGMSIDTAVSPELQAIRAEMIDDGIRPEQGLELFSRLLGQLRYPQIAISTIDVQHRLSTIDDVSRARRAAALQAARPLQASHARPALSTPYVAPRTPQEQAIAQVWQELLGIDQIGADDNFFALGGHSLLATQIVFRLRDTLGLELNLSQFFQAPTVAGLAAALELRAVQPEQPAVPLPVLTPQPAERHQPFPLTDMQQAYWIGRSGAFDMGNVSIHLYLEIESETLDLERFNRAWNLLVQRHDMLRAIILPDGQQQILEHVPPYQIVVEDLLGQPEAERAARLGALRERLSHQVLPTDQWPLFEIRAARTGAGRVRLFLSIDGSFADGRSYQILSNDLIRLYEDHSAFPVPFTLSFRDYVLALHSFQQSAAFQRSLEYWHRRLPSLPPAPELPLARNPATLEQPHFVRRSATFAPDRWRALKARTAEAGLTPTTLLLAAYAEVLAAWSRRPQFTLNVPRFNRLPLHPEVNQIIGEFASFTLLEVDSGRPGPFRERARRLQEQLWQDLEHQYVSGVHVLRELARRQGYLAGAAMPVVFTSVLNLEQTIHAASALSRLGDLVHSIAQTPQVWLDFTVGEDAGTLFFHWDAVDALFPEGLVEDMFGAYCALLGRLADDPASWDAPLRLLAPPAHLAQYEAVNATARSYPPAPALHTLIEAQAARTPAAPALVFEGRQMSYAELERRANQLAHHLRGLGVGPDVPVAIRIERSFELVVALLGVLKAGGAYVPIDPAYPAERQRFMLEDARPAVLLTAGQPAGGSGPAPRTALVDLVADWPAVAARPDTAPALNVGPDNLAYIIYTSGSTGRPKGAMNSHGAICNRLLWMQERYGLTPDDRVLQKTPASFDVSVWEFFWPLLAGAALVIARPDGHRDSRYLADLIEAEGVTTLHFVPSMLALFLEEPGLERLTALRRVICSGEALPYELQQRFFARLGAELHNLYGPTEAAVDVTAWQCRPDEARPVVPIGRPVANTQIHILDDDLQPRPVWVPGELYIGGVQLARGYLGRPDLTAERFVPNPFAERYSGKTAERLNDIGDLTDPSEHNGERFTVLPFYRSSARLYRTGDLARWLPDGSVEFLGRIDHQVKLRGFRIELGEIEAALRGHPAVQEAVVLLRDEGPQPQLVAYYVARGREPLPVEALRELLAAGLPDYMIPAAFVALPQLPLTPNGKVDRRALPAPESARPELEAGYCPPSSPVEQVLAIIWSEVLGVADPGVNDNFFALGGNSLHLIQVVTRLRQIFQINLSARTVLEAPQIRRLAEVVRSHAQPGQPERIAAILLRLRQLSDAEKRAMLVQERSSKGQEE
jgi:amino acid adenylation domain-containing protein